jgi:hypothetical protein
VVAGRTFCHAGESEEKPVRSARSGKKSACFDPVPAENTAGMRANFDFISRSAGEALCNTLSCSPKWKKTRSSRILKKAL